MFCLVHLKHVTRQILYENSETCDIVVSLFIKYRNLSADDVDIDIKWEGYQEKAEILESWCAICDNTSRDLLGAIDL